ncbi:MAG: FHA domain-containing protein [Gammaproteobacteria bacterium]|jgi:predicted component of type VI protein secretion system|nr:FHA domain-containing protein [Gammaproteobacteria bacterium]MBT3860976.1 FHA domain-containing protein [Gammaproteobacteria bacterium]MBT3986267.1 FHA domain-containing protein [Gammaproteobacteria bacterium]MBT4256364.1 FHA domain-containing protein [Gammaproteobacteria bacterium]MBT4582659.1 FHA domain-containing protein [Gammaproteobacteria bacterium]
MPKISAYSIGRSAESDIRLEDSTISRNHAELVITADDKYYLTDCGSSGGTYSLQGNQKTAIKQGFVDQVDNLCFGEYHTSVQQLISKIADLVNIGNAYKGKQFVEASPQDELPEGPVHRDPVSGEIVSDDS